LKRDETMGLQKHINLFNYALDSVFAHKSRTIAITASLMIAIMVLGSVAFLTDGLEQEAELSASFAPDITIQYLQGGRQVPIPLSYTQDITRIADVDIVPRAWGYIYHHNKLYTIMGIDVRRMPIPKEIGFAISSGRFLEPNDSGKALIGNSFARTFGIRAGERLQLYDQKMKPYEYTVAGIFDAKVQLYTADLIVIPIEDAIKFLEMDNDHATDLCVYLRDPAQTIAVATKISNQLPNLRVLTRQVLRDALLAAYGARSGFVSVVWFILLIAVVLIAWNHTSAVSTETRREVGILKALGFSITDILEVRLLECIILGLFSASVGIFLSILFDVYLGAPVISDFMLGWASVYPEFPLPVMIKLDTVATLYAVAVFPLLLGSLTPSWYSAIEEPDVAIRGV